MTQRTTQKALGGRLKYVALARTSAGKRVEEATLGASANNTRRPCGWPRRILHKQQFGSHWAQLKRSATALNILKEMAA